MKQTKPTTPKCITTSNISLIKRLFVIIPLLLGFLSQNYAQTIMFDDFTYSGVNDPQLSAFNKWSIVSGTNGPPSNAQYSRDNVKFITDPANPNNRIMTLSTTVNGTTKATTHSRIETSGFEYFEGTYAARVYFSETPYQYKDANIQTFYTIVSHLLGNDGSRYSEIDFEYMAADKWGTATDKQVMYMTSWNRYIPEPWQAWKNYFVSQKSWEGWHTCIFSATNGKDVKFWIDGQYFGAMSVTDNDGSSVYPRSNMQVAFANWIWNNVTGSSTANRTTTLQVDWTLYYKDQELSPQQVENLVASYRSSGLQRRNLLGQTYYTSVNQAPTVSITAPANNAGFTAPANITITANATDPDGTITNVQFYNGSTLLGSDASAPYSFTWNNVAAGNYAITVKATDNNGATTTSSIINISVTNPIVQSPYGGSPSPIPGTIEAENYDLGGQNVAFNDLTAANEGNAYRNDAVDIEPTNGGGYNVGYIITGEWLEYTVNVTAGTYKIDARVAAIAPGKTFRLELDGATIANFTVPNTGNWQTWQTVSANNVTLTGGTKILRMYATSTDFNLDKIIFSPVVNNQPPVINITSPANNASFTAPASIVITANANDTDGSVANVQFYNGATLLGTDATAPYSFTWNNVAAGTYTIRAVATDNNGATSNASININVSNPSGQSPYGGSAWAIPGVIEAENYDLGGQGIAFNDLTPANEGGAYRNDAVDVEPTNGGYNVGYVIAGEWLEYTTNVTAGTYRIDARVAAIAYGKTFRLEIDGVTIATFSVPNTGAWHTFQTISVNNVVLTGGQKVLRIYAVTGDFNIDKLTFSNITTNQSPFSGTPATIPGTIEAENYDLGGQGIAYNDLTAANEGQAYRTDAVDIEPTNGGGYNIGWIIEGEWYEYTVNVEAGTYKIDARVAAIAAGKSFRLELDGVVIANFTVPNTGNWQTFQTVSVNNISLSGGQKILRIYATSTDFNIDRLIFSKVVTPAMAAPANVSNSPNPFELNTTLTLDLKQAGYVSVKLLTKEGHLLQTIQEGYMHEGIHQLEFDASDLKNDIYFLRCETPTGTIVHKILKSL
ncbi:MAG TPA: carbohydrate-binding protein [Cytophagaceae bacterium]